MSASLHLAKPDDLDRLCALVAAFHAETGIAQTDEGRRAGLAPLLDGIPHGAAYLIGPARAPIGYVIVTFGWSVEFGGMDAFIDELYLRRAVRRRGIASEVLGSLPKALAGAGIKGLHLEVDRTDEATQRLYARAGFAGRERFMLMSRQL
ncbi:GNAT family N-acetyltransferase [Sedimentitalea sp. HM32M-2]|uniref:GNAT family N-acetyltransferase n=1 Tax=Sedimentitalea sp. HM32M-2 TaxID=3351566 RepID=UPI003645E4E1